MRRHSLVSLAGWRQDRRAAAALEFGLVAPVFLLFLFGILGVGLDGFYQLSLDDAVRDAARRLQIGAPASSGAGGFVAAVCEKFGILASNCSASITYSVQSSAPASGFAGITPKTLPASGALANSFSVASSAGTGSVSVLAQVAYPLPFTVPYVGTMITATGTNSILATATVRAEPSP